MAGIPDLAMPSLGSLGLDDEQPCALKFLISNNAAGSIIGKGGATISQFQEQSKAKIKVANSNDFFPGTSERCVLVTGSIDELISAAGLVVMKIQEAEQHAATERDMNAIFTAKMLVPNSSVGAIIGKAGSTINEMSAQCGAQMKVSSKASQAMMGVTERMVSVTGDLSQMSKAVNLIVRKMQETPAAAQYQNMTTQYGMRNRQAMPAAVSHPGAPTSKTITVMDSLAGFVVGKEGATLQDIQRQSGARITMSRRGEYVPGTTDRCVTITGAAAAVHNAHFLICQKIQQAAIKDVTGMETVNAMTHNSQGSLLQPTPALSTLPTPPYETYQ